MRILVWFRADLRTDDNTALAAAARDATRGVAAVFAVCPRQWRAHDWGDAKVEFVLRNLACLRERLLKLNIPLRIVTTPAFDGVPAALRRLAQDLDCDAVYANRELEVNEARRDAAVRAALERDGRTLRLFDDQTILPPESVRTGEGRFYTVFTPFKRAWLARLAAVGDVTPLGPPRRQPELLCAPDDVPEEVAGFDRGRGLAELWPAGENVALARLGRFIDERIATYKSRRDYPGIGGTSRLSPYLAAGVLSPRRCLAGARAANEGHAGERRPGPSCWISELVWREFYRHVLVGFPRVSMGRAFKPATEQIAWRESPADFAAWQAGRTGVPIVDAGLRQLAAEGWMHNRVRMIVAMFLAKDLLLDWRLGERHFMRHLVDGDLASNNGGWQWSASTGTDAAPYFRIFNPYSQSAKFDPDGAYIRAYVPELRDVPAAALHDPDALAAARTGAAAAYPLPICDRTATRQRVLAAFRVAAP